MKNISENRLFILNEIKMAHSKSSFTNNKVPTLVAVSKKQEDYKIDFALTCGQKVFGENRVQEAKERWEKKLKNNKQIELRLIGPLQTNKVKEALNLFDIIETIDREKLAKSIYKELDDKKKTKQFYIQVNTGNENQKSGISTRNVNEFIKFCKFDLSLPIVGLMCIPPINEEPAMHVSLLNKIAGKNNLNKLSMGMSNDYLEAIKFGSTSVRLGTLFFGPRKY